MNYKFLLFLCMALLLLSACAVDQRVRHSAVVIEEVGQQSQQEPVALSESLEPSYVAVLNRNHNYMEPGSPVAELLASAKAQQKQGRLDSAANMIERALRISPRNPMLWHQLASLRYQQGDLQQALQLANKSNSFAGTDKQLLVNNWRIIAHVKLEQGDQTGALSAQAKVAELLK